VGEGEEVGETTAEARTLLSDGDKTDGVGTGLEAGRTFVDMMGVVFVDTLRRHKPFPAPNY
jgi:hypothetical protein